MCEFFEEYDAKAVFAPGIDVFTIKNYSNKPDKASIKNMCKKFMLETLGRDGVLVIKICSLAALTAIGVCMVFLLLGLL